MSSRVIFKLLLPVDSYSICRNVSSVVRSVEKLNK